MFLTGKQILYFKIYKLLLPQLKTRVQTVSDISGYLKPHQIDPCNPHGVISRQNFWGGELTLDDAMPLFISHGSKVAKLRVPFSSLTEKQQSLHPCRKTVADSVKNDSFGRLKHFLRFLSLCMDFLHVVMRLPDIPLKMHLKSSLYLR